MGLDLDDAHPPTERPIDKRYSRMAEESEAYDTASLVR